MAMRLAGRKFFWDPDSWGQWGFQVKHVPTYWALTFRNGDGLGGFTGGRKSPGYALPSENRDREQGEATAGNLLQSPG